jgi:hypothetical protein
LHGFQPVFGGHKFRPGGLGAAPELPPEVDFPAGRRRDIQVGRILVRSGSPGKVAGACAGVDIEPGVLIGAGKAEGGTRLFDPSRCNFDAAIVFERCRYQLIKCGILEEFPPTQVDRILGLHRVSAVCFGRFGCGPLVVRAHGRTSRESQKEGGCGSPHLERFGIQGHDRSSGTVVAFGFFS